jgi:hypothetical protein
MRYLVIALLFAAACGDNKDAKPGDAGIDGQDVTPVGACLERPTDLDQPPTGQLPCELLPPGFVAP